MFKLYFEPSGFLLSLLLILFIGPHLCQFYLEDKEDKSEQEKLIYFKNALINTAILENLDISEVNILHDS